MEYAIYSHDYCLSCKVRANEIGFSALIWREWNRGLFYHRCVFCQLLSQHPELEAIIQRMKQETIAFVKGTGEVMA